MVLGMGVPLNNLTGRCFGRWTVLRLAPRSGRNTRWICRCDCGRYRSVQGNTLTSGTSVSCGCLRDEKSGQREYRHGMSRSGEYDIWNQARNRCFNPKNSRYKHYGARGIRMCEQWRRDFSAFYRDMGPRPSAKHTIDRINNLGHYEPGNCRWITNKEQQRNRLRTRLFTYQGMSMIAADWAAHFGMTPHVLKNRLMRGWDMERAISTPIQRKG